MLKVSQLSAAMALFGLASCQNMTAPQPAVLVQNDTESITLIKQALSEYLGRAQINLGAGDLTQQSFVTVLPPRVTAMEGNSVAIPQIYELQYGNGLCYVMDKPVRFAITIRGLACRVLPGETP